MIDLTMSETTESLLSHKEDKEKIKEMLRNIQWTSFIEKGDIISAIYRGNKKQEINAGAGCKMGGNSFMIILDFSGKETELLIL